MNFQSLDIAQGIGKEGQVPGGGDMGIQLAKGPCCGVPAVGKGHEPRFIPFFVEGDEAFPGHVHFASHFHVGRRIFNVKGNGVNGLYIGRHVFPHPAVAAG